MQHHWLNTAVKKQWPILEGTLLRDQQPPLRLKCIKRFSHVLGVDAVLQPGEGPALSFPLMRWFDAWQEADERHHPHPHQPLTYWWGQRSEGDRSLSQLCRVIEVVFVPL